MNNTRFARALLALALALAALPATGRQASDWPAWAAPQQRKHKTLFAPRPTGGDNIFKGEAEKWLADAVEKLCAGSLRRVKDEYVAQYVSQLGRHLAAHSAAPQAGYDFVVIDDSEVNAMSVGGGRVYVNLGMLQAVESEDELAGVLAHEIGHDAFRHAPKTVTRQLFWMKGVRKVKTPAEVEKALEALFAEYERKPLAAFGEKLLGFSRFDELEADRAAFYNAYKAGYNPRALPAVLKRMERGAKKELGKEYGKYQLLTFLFGTHPPTSQRALAFDWESNFVKMPKKGERHGSAAFDAMKARVAKL
jgi:predicted Zn-dependent protease